MGYFKALACGVAGTLLCSCPAWSQAIERSGDLTARVTYDSNTARASDAVAEARGVKQDDVIADILATFDLKSAVGRQTIFARGSVGYDFHQENPQLDSERVNVSGGLTRAFGRCGATLSGGYFRAQSDQEDLGLETDKNTLERKSVNAAFNCGRIIGVAPIVTASRQWVDNSAASRQDANFTTTSGTVGVSYDRPALGRLSLYGEYRETVYPNRLALVNGNLEQDSFEVYSGVLRYERRLGARVDGTISAAYTSLEPGLPGAEGYEGITYGAAVNYRPSSRVSTSFTFERDTKPSNRLDSTYSLSDAFSLKATYALGARTSVSAGGSWSNNQFEGGGRIPGVDVTEEERQGIFGSVNYKLNRRLALSLNAQHETREADVPGFDYEAERVSLSASTAF